MRFNITLGELLNYATMDVPGHQIDWAEIATRIFICITGLAGNILAIFVILTLREFRKAATHWYVLQRVIADSLFLLTLPFKIDEEIHGHWRLTDGWCKAKETILFLNYYASILFLVIMGIDRYIAVCHGFSDFLQKFRTHSAVALITILVWTISLLMCIPVMLYSGKIGVEPGCHCSYTFPKYEPTAEENCRKEGFTSDEDMKVCLSLSEPIVYSEGSCQIVTVSNSTFGTDEDYTLWYSDIGLGGVIPDVGANGSKASSGPGLISEGNYGTYDYPSIYPGLSGGGIVTNGSDVPPYYFFVGETGGAAPDNETSDINISATLPPLELPPSKNTIPPECHYQTTGRGWWAFLLVNFIGMFIIPLFILAFCYFAIILKSNQGKVSRTHDQTPTVSSTSEHHSKSSKRLKSAATSRANAERNRVTIMCAVLVILFLVCWLPFHAVHIAKINGINSTKRWCDLLSFITTLLTYMNSALNPYLYNFLGTRFWQRVKEAAGYRHGRKKYDGSSSANATALTHMKPNHSTMGIMAEAEMVISTSSD